jgi:hypothetical protein
MAAQLRENRLKATVHRLKATVHRLETTVHCLETTVHRLKATVHRLETVIHVLSHLFKATVHVLSHLFKAAVTLFPGGAYLFHQGHELLSGRKSFQYDAPQFVAYLWMLSQELRKLGSELFDEFDACH